MLELSPVTIIIGLVLVLGLGLAFYFVGALILSRMTEARKNAETEKTFVGGKTAEGEREAPVAAAREPRADAEGGAASKSPL